VCCVLPTRCHQEIKRKHFQRNLSFINNNWPLQRNFFALAHPPKVFLFVSILSTNKWSTRGCAPESGTFFHESKDNFPVWSFSLFGCDVSAETCDPPHPQSAALSSQKKKTEGAEICNVLTPDGQSKRPPSHHFCDMYDDNLNSARASLGFSKSNFFFAQPRRLSELVFFPSQKET
jgi:hypothetical protein